MAKVFITYDSVDTAASRKLMEVLRGQGVEAWMPDRTPAGGTVPTELHQEIDDCSVLLVLLSRAGAESEAILRDARRAVARSKTVGVVRLDALQMPDRLGEIVGNLTPLDWRVNEVQSNDYIVNAVRDLQGRAGDQGKPAGVATMLPLPDATVSEAGLSTLVPESVSTAVSDMHDNLNELRAAASIDAAPRPGVAGRIDRFEIIRILGQGGMGVVLLARDPQNGATVAIKTITPRYVGNERAQSRFIKEASNMQRMTHPNVLKVSEVVNRPNGAYYVMPFVDAGSLARVLNADKPVDERQILNVGVQVADALRYAHDEAGVIHRDIKPENILVDAAGQAYVSDFGLIRSMLVNETVPEGDRGWTVGTARYMAPEIADGKAGDTRADIYSFGAMLYELATGHAPYEDVAPGEPNHRIVERIKTESPTPVLKLNPHLSPEIAKVIEGAMARELRDRYAHMKDALEDLKRIKLGVGVRGTRDSTAPAPAPSPVRLTFAQRLVRQAAALLVIVLVLGAFAVILAKNNILLMPGDPGYKQKRTNMEIVDQRGLGDQYRTPEEIAATLADRLTALIEKGDNARALSILHGKQPGRQMVWTQDDAKNNNGVPFMNLAAKYNRIELIRFMVETMKFDVNVIDAGTGHTPLDDVNRSVEPGKKAYETLRTEFGAKSRSELPK